MRCHYIPQFLLRNFTDEAGRLTYWEKASDASSKKKPLKTFCVSDLYKDDSEADPFVIEHGLAKYEMEIAELIKNKLLCNNPIVMTDKEVESLKLFLSIMAIRAKRVADVFADGSDHRIQEFVPFFKDGEDSRSFWKRNLKALVKCRYVMEVYENEDIAEPIRGLVFRDTEALFGLYPVVLEKRGRYDFLLADPCPTSMSAEAADGLKMPIYYFFPLSPTRCLVLVSDLANDLIERIRFFDRTTIRRPMISADGKTYFLRIRRAYERDVRFINAVQLDNCASGAVMADKEKILIETNWHSVR